MRSTQIVVFLVLLNASAAVISAGVGAAIGVQPAVGGDSTISETAGNAESVSASNSGQESDFVGGFLSAADFITELKNIVFFGPEMLRNLGAPNIIVDGLQSVVVFVVAFDVVEIISGRVLS